MAAVFSMLNMFQAAMRSPPAITTASTMAANGAALQVDLGYATYQGGVNDYGFNMWQGIRYAASPTDDNRWRAPQIPPNLGRDPIQATSPPPKCPQTTQSGSAIGQDYRGDEDCLFLNVVAPPNAANLPVLAYIHGGGYAAGMVNTVDFRQWANASDDGFVAVDIQYRLGAFGFLGAENVQKDGVLNAGLLDQQFALQWTQDHISKFGGNPRDVTIVGISAGGGSVIAHTLSNDGGDGDKYFQKALAASPFIQPVYRPTDSPPNDYFNEFAANAGCGNAANKMQCLRSADTSALQSANAASASGKAPYGIFPFTPVIDNKFYNSQPSQQLASKKINGKLVLTGHNAAEAPSFVSPYTRDLSSFLRERYPLLTDADITLADKMYASLDAPTTNYASCGDCVGPTANDVGSFGTGDQQRILNLYAELTIVCPSYWLASAYAGSSYKYQWSVAPAAHNFDTLADGAFPYPSFASQMVGPDMFRAFTQIFMNWVTGGNPSISNQLANGAFSSNPGSSNPASNWPTWNSVAPRMINLNQTSSEVSRKVWVDGYPASPYPSGSSIRNDIRAVDASSFEGGRGARCDFWKGLGDRTRV